MSIKQFGPTLGKKPFPPEMRRQVWPLCCGASILSGFKDAAKLSEEDLVKGIEESLQAIPDFQVFEGETLNPKMTFVTLNTSQMDSPKIINAMAKAGFVKFAEARPRSGLQGFYVRDDSKTWKVITE